MTITAAAINGLPVSMPFSLKLAVLPFLTLGWFVTCFDQYIVMEDETCVPQSPQLPRRQPATRHD